MAPENSDSNFIRTRFVQVPLIYSVTTISRSRSPIQPESKEETKKEERQQENPREPVFVRQIDNILNAIIGIFIGNLL